VAWQKLNLELRQHTPDKQNGRAHAVPRLRQDQKKGQTMKSVPMYLLVGRTRFELVTNGLKVRCSTN
jgi:hypothetical protein